MQKPFFFREGHVNAAGRIVLILASSTRVEARLRSTIAKVQTLTTKNCKGAQTNMPKNVESIKT